MVVLNYGELNPRVRAQKDIQMVNRYRWNLIKYPSKRVDRKTFEKNNPISNLNFCILKKWKYVQFMLQNITKRPKSKFPF